MSQEEGASTAWTRVWATEGERLQVQRQTLDGVTRHRFVSNLPGDGAVVVARRGGRLLLVEIFRPVLGRTLLELPRGQAEREDPDPVSTGRRELLEESGFALLDGLELGRVYPDSGLSGDAVHVIRGTVAPTDDGQGSVAEFAVHWLTPAEVETALAEGRVRDAITLAALALDRVTP